MPEATAITDLWLDDDPNRVPPPCGLDWTWVTNYDSAIEALRSGTVIFASLDHDLADEHYTQYFQADHVSGADYDTSQCKERTGLDVLIWMRDNNVWPTHGIRIHTMNHVRKPIMLEMVKDHYGRTFQYQYAGTHQV